MSKNGIDATIYRSKVTNPDTAEYARATISSKPTAPGFEAADLTMPVKFSFDRATWYAAEWYGDQWNDAREPTKKVRRAHLLMTESNLPDNGNHTLFARLSDNPEAPIINAGTIAIL